MRIQIPCYSLIMWVGFPLTTTTEKLRSTLLLITTIDFKITMINMFRRGQEEDFEPVEKNQMEILELKNEICETEDSLERIAIY